MCFVVAAILGFGSSAVAAASMIVFGGTMAFFALTGKRPVGHPALAPASRRFHELADPTRPLTPEDLSLQSVDRGRPGDSARAGPLEGGPGAEAE